MNTTWSEDDLKQLARQLSCPDGEAGISTGERMSVSNGNMIQRTIDLLRINDRDNVAEIGPGNGSHVKAVLSKASNVTYTGIDISATMIEAARQVNTDFVESGQASFVLSNGKSLDFAANSFDKIFTVNTVYFWEEPAQYTREIYRVLKPDGQFCLSFAHRDFRQKLPFTQYGFELYDSKTVENLLSNTQFSIERTVQETEQIVGNMGQPVERPIVMIVATKI